MVFSTPSDYKGVGIRLGMHNYLCGKLQMGATASTGAIFGKVSYLDSSLLESGKSGLLLYDVWALLRCQHDNHPVDHGSYAALQDACPLPHGLP